MERGASRAGPQLEAAAAAGSPSSWRRLGSMPLPARGAPAQRPGAAAQPVQHRQQQRPAVAVGAWPGGPGAARPLDEDGRKRSASRSTNAETPSSSGEASAAAAAVGHGRRRRHRPRQQPRSSGVALAGGASSRSTPPAAKQQEVQEDAALAESDLMALLQLRGSLTLDRVVNVCAAADWCAGLTWRSRRPINRSSPARAAEHLPALSTAFTRFHCASDHQQQ